MVFYVQVIPNIISKNDQASNTPILGPSTIPRHSYIDILGVNNMLIIFSIKEP